MDTELGARLRRLDATDAAASPLFGYDALMARHATTQTNRRRRQRIARATAGALVIAVAGASVWRLAPHDVARSVAATPAPQVEAQPRMVRADSYLAVAALADHIARLDDALNDA